LVSPWSAGHTFVGPRQQPIARLYAAKREIANCYRLGHVIFARCAVLDEKRETQQTEFRRGCVLKAVASGPPATQDFMQFFQRATRPLLRLLTRVASPQDADRSRRGTVTLTAERLEERRLLTLLGAQLFPSDNAWNQNIAAAPVAANSAAIISHIGNSI